eukprot:g4216.t1
MTSEGEQSSSSSPGAELDADTGETKVLDKAKVKELLKDAHSDLKKEVSEVYGESSMGKVQVASESDKEDEDETEEVFVHKTSHGNFVITAEKSKTPWVAKGSLENTVMEVGWAQLRIESSDKFTDEDQAYAAGYLEGYLTRDLIHAFLSNTANLPDNRDKLLEFFKIQDQYLRSEVSADHVGQKQTFWRQVGLVLKQLDGLRDGYNKHSRTKLSLYEFWLLNMDGDLIAVDRALGKGLSPNNSCIGAESRFSALNKKSTIESVNSEQAKLDLWQSSLLQALNGGRPDRNGNMMRFSSNRRLEDVPGSGKPSVNSKELPGSGKPSVNSKELPGSGSISATISSNRQLLRQLNEKFRVLLQKARCSAIVKLTGDVGKEEDILLGHNSWEDYVEMLRIYKHFHLRFKDRAMTSPKTSFSSYPGMLSSTDDFYILSSGLVVAETTIDVLDESLYDRICSRHGVVSWVRNLVANRIASSGKEWANIYATHNAGTYNCQWMIVDYNKLQVGDENPIQRDTFWVIETIPGMSHAEDMTDVLKTQRYWPSVNRPFFPDIRTAAGYPNDEELDALKEPGKPLDTITSFDDNPRGRIFKAKQGNVKELDDLKVLMRDNHYQDDPFSNNDPSLAISARYDLPGSSVQIATGAVDAKVVNSSGAKEMRAYIIAGPTHEDQPVFTFDDENGLWKDIKHEMMPTEWDFDWIEVEGF